MTDEDGCLLVLVVDVHPKISLSGSIEKYLNSCIAFANIHVTVNVKNRMSFIAANHQETRFIFPRMSEKAQRTDRQKDGRLELLCHIDDSIEIELKSMCSDNGVAGTVTSTGACLLSGAICRGLLYVKRLEREDRRGKKVHARILVIKSSLDTGGQYLNYINAYLTAQKMGVSIDVCVVGSDCGFLQQGADITGGYYQRVDDVNELLQSLILHYQPDLPTRKRLNLPHPDSVDYRAACFCHRILIDMGNVCSNCLSVYCKGVPFCCTCSAKFLDFSLPKNMKSKKLKK